MDKKKAILELKRFLGWVVLKSVSGLAKITPLRFVDFIADILGSFGFFVAVRPRKTSLESLSIAFANTKTDQELRKIAKQSFCGMVKCVFELLVILEQPQLIKNKVKVEGLENLKTALSKGRGVIALTAHFGNFPLMTTTFAKLGYPSNVMMRYMRDERANVVFQEKRDKAGIRSIYTTPRQACVSDTLSALRRNEIVFMQMDQNFGTGGVFVNFFGKKAATPVGPIIFAQRAKASIVPMFIVRNSNDTYKIIVEEEFELKEGKDKDETILINAQALTNITERYIRKYPAEWGWMHRRWKSRPSEEAGNET